MAGSISDADIAELAKVWRPEVIDFLRTGDDSGIGPNERRILTRFSQNPSRVSRDLLIQFGKLDQIDSGSIDAFLQEWYRGYEQRPVTPPTPVESTVPGSTPIDTDLEPGETSRPSLEQIEAAQPQVSVYNPATSSIETMPAQKALDLGLISRAEFLAAQPETDTRPTPEMALAGTVQGDGDGGGGGGVASDVSGQPTDFDQAIPEDWRNAAREAYPGYYAIVRNIPEIAALLEEAIVKGYTDEQFQAQLEQTNWWKQTTASAREWDINGERDPASQQTAIDNRVALIRQAALDNFGVRLGAESLNELATDSLRLGWSQQFLLNAIGDVATQSTAGISQLRAGYVGQQLRQTANEYGIAVSDATFNKFVNQIAVGQETQDTFQQYALTQAKNLFPSVSDRLDAGETFQQIVDPYRENAARLLEIDPDDIDFTQAEYIKALTYQDERGEQRPMSFTEWGDYIRQTRSFGYEYTDQARSKAYDVANQLANLFGKA